MLPLLPLALLLSLTTGCQSTYKEESARLRHLWEDGNVEAAAQEASQKAGKHTGSVDSVVWRLEQGATLRASEEYLDSNEAFDQAEVKVDRFENQAPVQIGQTTKATFSNLDTLPYKGYAYDKIMLNTYKALNFLSLGKPEKARIELNRSMQRQEEAVRLNARRIEKAQAAAKREQMNVDRLQDHPRLTSKLKEQNIYPQASQLEAYEDYVNPFTVLLDGLFFMTSATGPSDLERAHQSLERVYGMMNDRQFIKQDLNAVESLMTGKELPEMTYVIFETGLAPIREQIRIDIPFFIITEEVPYVGAAFPKLEFRDRYLSSLRVTHSGKTVETDLVADFDSIIAQDFRNHLPIVISRTLIASAVKAAATYGLQEGAKAAGLPGIVGGLIGAGYQLAVNVADLRTWTTLPKQIQYCRIATPPDRKLVLTAPYDSTLKKTVTIQPGGTVNVVYAKSITPGTPLLVSQFQLK